LRELHRSAEDVDETAAKKAVASPAAKKAKSDATSAKKAKSEVKGFVKAEGETLNGDKEKKEEEKEGDASDAAGAEGSGTTGLAAALKVIQEPCGDDEFVMVDGKAAVDQVKIETERDYEEGKRERIRWILFRFELAKV